MKIKLYAISVIVASVFFAFGTQAIAELVEGTPIIIGNLSIVISTDKTTGAFAQAVAAQVVDTSTDNQPLKVISYTYAPKSGSTVKVQDIINAMKTSYDKVPEGCNFVKKEILIYNYKTGMINISEYDEKGSLVSSSEKPITSVPIPRGLNPAAGREPTANSPE